MGLIFVGGIHGVGKSKFCGELAPIIGAGTLSAGDVLKAAGLQGSDKPVTDVAGNQAFVIDVVREHLLKTPDLLLDGHFALLRPGGAVSAIPFEVFDGLMPTALLVLTAPLHVVRERLFTRDGSEYPAETLKALQSLELAQAVAVAARLKIPGHVIDEGTPAADVAGLLLQDGAKGRCK